MRIIDTSLLPFPHYNNKKPIDGSLLKWPKVCSVCKQKRCLQANNIEISLCSYGYNYIKVDNDIIIAGIIVREFSGSSQARNKRIRNEKHNLITKTMLDRLVAKIKSFNDAEYKKIESNKKRIIQEYIDAEQFKHDFLSSLKPEIQKGLSFVHDYKQINTQISQNINVIIESRYNGDDLESKLDQATREEKAIYAASKFLSEKLNVAKFLLHPEWLEKKDACVRFRFHGVIIKYRRIYSPRFETKNIKVSLSGTSYKEIIANAQAVSVIPHTLIDNAAKYSPYGGRIEIYIQDYEDYINFSISSFGPLIKDEEKSKIFSPFFRTEGAKQVEEEGAGYGLYISQMIAKNHLGSEIKVEQEKKNKFKQCYWTTFSLNLPLKAAILL